MNWRSLKNKLTIFKTLPVHPQWLVYKSYNTELRQLAASLHDQRVLDIGCGKQDICKYLHETTDYIGLDYYETATKWYHTLPQIFGDAQKLPFNDSSMDTVLLMDVLEHLPDPDACLMEIRRVLKPGGKCILQVPFLYPVHDAPLDFQRWTRYGLEAVMVKHGFTISKFIQSGKPIETAALLSNIAICKTFLNWLENKNPALLPGFFLLLMVPIINVFSWILGLISPADDLMPYRYHGIFKKIQGNSPAIQNALSNSLNLETSVYS